MDRKEPLAIRVGGDVQPFSSLELPAPYLEAGEKGLHLFNRLLSLPDFPPPTFPEPTSSDEFKEQQATKWRWAQTLQQRLRQQSTVTLM